jgi:bacterial/archaeal transporter family protein
MSRIPKWLVYCVLAILFWGIWGVVAKEAVRYIDPWLGQVLLTIGWMPLVLGVAFSRNMTVGKNKVQGILFASVTGVISAAGNVCFFGALSKGGPASTVVPISGLYPLVTVLAAVFFLRERMNRIQIAGIGLALAAILLLGEG